jgi:hypothetical protein
VIDAWIADLAGSGDPHAPDPDRLAARLAAARARLAARRP